MTLNEALILSYIKRGICYGYRILNHVRESRSDEWVEFSRAGLYKTLDKLEQNGHITKKIEQNGGRPPKKVYSITTEGENALTGFLENDFSFDFLVRSDLDAFIVTAVAATPDAAFLAAKLEQRLEAVAKHIAELKNDWPQETNDYPFIVYALYKRRLDMLKHEQDWLKWLLGILQGSHDNVLEKTYGEISG